MDILDRMRKFLDENLYNALNGLFVGAVTWEAHPLKKDQHYLRGIGMSASFVQARALYEFFYNTSEQYKTPQDGGNAQARHFAPTWNEPKSRLYSDYMAHGQPAQKRIFHLVYCRSKYSGGTAPDESDHLKNQVVEVAKDLRRLTEEFAKRVEPQFQHSVESALRKALDEAKGLAKHYEIPNSF